ncbi:DUF4360 domain-containing protein [Spirillospora sp. NBC_00431]
MRKRIVVSAAAFAVLAAGPVAPASASPLVRGPDGSSLEVALANGSGCSLGTVAVDLADDAETFTLDYSDYTARAGGSSEPAEARKRCQVKLKVGHPENFTYAISRVDYRVAAGLQPGASAVQRGVHYIQEPSGYTTFTLKGPHDGNFQFTDRVPEDQLVWKMCGVERSINVNTELRVDKGTSDPSKVSSISMNSAEGSRTTYHLAWKLCS